MHAAGPKRRLELVRRPANVPPSPALFGREEIRARLLEELASGARLVTLLGPPGMGKTTLARATLARIDKEGWFCDLSQAHREDDLCFAVLSLFEGQRRVHLADADLATRVREMLAELGDALLVLDNFEQLAFAAGVVHAWLEAAPRLAIVVTSRERLAIPGETVLELPPLADTAAVGLLVARAREAGADAGTDAVALAEIVRRLDGIPLAIELAAARMRLLSAKELAKRLGTSTEVLGGGRGAPRHATLAKAIDWSWNLLPENEQTALARCSVFAGSFSLEAAENVARAPMETIAALRDKSLIHADGDGRLALYMSIREYAAKKLAETNAGEAVEARLRHARHFAAMAKRFNDARSLQDDEPQPELHASIRRENENLAAALAFAQSMPPALESALLQRDLAIAIASLYALPGDACASALSAALAALGALRDRVADEAAVLLARQLVSSALGRHDACLRDLDELRARDGVPANLRTTALVFRGIQERYQGDPRRALASHEEAARELEHMDLRRVRTMNDACTGRLHCDLRNGDAARDWNGRAIEASDAIGDLWLGALALANLAQHEQEEGHFERAEELLERALGRLRDAGEAHYEAVYASACGDLSFERETPDAARRWYSEGARYFAPLPAHRQTGILHAAFAALEAGDGDLVAAASHLELAQRSAARSQNPIVRAVVELQRGVVELARATEAERPELLARCRALATRSTPLADTSMDVRFAQRILVRTIARLDAGGAQSTSSRLRLARDGSWVEGAAGSARIDLGRRGALRRILLALVAQHEKTPGQGLSVDALVETGWPGERVLVDAAATRVRVAVSTLRRLGLRAFIVTRDDGYLLDPRIEIERAVD